MHCDLGTLSPSALPSVECDPDSPPSPPSVFVNYVQGIYLPYLGLHANRAILSNLIKAVGPRYCEGESLRPGLYFGFLITCQHCNQSLQP